MMQPEDFHKISKALADPQRFDILERIAAARPLELACKQLVQDLSISQATISHHLKELAEAGLVEGRRDGQFVLFRFLPETLAGYRDELARRTKPR